MTASQRAAISRRRSRGAGLVNVGLASRTTSWPRSRSSDLELVEEDVAARLADVEQRDRLRPAARRQRALGRGVALGRGIEDLQAAHVQGSTLTVTGADPISPAAQPPKTMLNRPASPPA